MLPDLFPNQTPTFAKRANRFGSTKTPKQRGKYLLEHGWPLFPAGMNVDNSCVSTLSSRCLHFQCAFPQLPVQGARWRHLALHSADSCTLPVGTSSETARTKLVYFVVIGICSRWKLWAFDWHMKQLWYGKSDFPCQLSVQCLTWSTWRNRLT